MSDSGNEQERLQALESYSVLDTPPEAEFDEITRLAAVLLGVPSAAISFIDDHRQWFKARVGIPFAETPRDQAFCAHAVAACDFVEVSDATKDERFANNPLVTSEGGIRFYAGAPLIMASGHCLGTLCVLDSQPHPPLSEQQRGALKDLARLVVERIEARKERLESQVAAKVVNATSDAVLAVDRKGTITFWNGAAERMFGFPSADAVGADLDLILPALADVHLSHGATDGATSPTGGTVELIARRASGQEFPIELSFARWHSGDDAGDGGYAAIIRDVTLQKELERDRADARLFLDSIVTHLPAMLFVKDSITREYLLLNKAGEEIIGRPADEIVGRTDRELFPKVGDAYSSRDTKVLDSAGVETHESDFTREDGRTIRLRTKRIVVDAPEANRKYILGLTDDVTTLRRSEARVLYLAQHDSLTGLVNRSSFVDELAGLVSSGRHLAILTIDLDRFKVVNDQFGHLAGDNLLIEVGDRLRRIAGDNATVARIGGDEFTIVTAVDDPRRHAEQMAEAVIQQLAEPYVLDRHVAHIGASVGVVFSPEDGTTVQDLRQAADLALYRAKADGRGSVRFYSADLDQAASERRKLECDLHYAVERGEIRVNYQPVVSAQTGQITSFEALARWTHPERGPISPEVFIGIAEECGLVAAIGQHVLTVACQTAARWSPEIRVAVNLSPLQFETRDLVATVAQTLVETGLAPHRLQLEVTESLVIRDVEKTFGILTELRSLGVQILLDDFGVGYSSLSYFERFPFDKIKIDRSFVHKLTTTRAARAIIEAVVGLGRTLDMGVVAEGVETTEQMEQLVELGCTHLQGYLFSEPKPESAFAHVLNKDTARPALRKAHG